MSSTPTGNQLWGGRFATGIDPAFDAFQRSLPFDRRLVNEDIEGSIAWASALGRAGILQAQEVTTLTSALQDLGEDLRVDPSSLGTSSAEDVHGFVEAALQERAGDLARKLHTGRSRNDQVATDLKLHLRLASAGLLDGLKELATELVELAGRTSDMALPGYTHLQRAQPITVGHHALAYAEMLARDASRIQDAARRMDTCPLGSGALAGTAFPIEREELASSLGFASATRNSLDAVSDRDHVLEFLFVCTTIGIHLSRLAEDWIFFATTEAGFLELGDAVCTGSSLMPQKKNPDGLELVRGKSARLLGHLTAMAGTLKGLPLAYNKDMQEDKEGLLDALDTTQACLTITAQCVRGATFHRERCETACSTGFLDATDLADLLVRAGVAFRDAHERVGGAVREALESGCELSGLSEARQRDLFPELEGSLEEALAIPAVLERRSALGGTSPTRVRAEVLAWTSQRLPAWPT
jgi:argininosuccinate lyase